MNRVLLLPLGVLAACSTLDQEPSETRPLGDTVLSPQTLKEARLNPVAFEPHIKPILEAKCAMCHNRSALPGRMSLENRAAAEKSGALGTFIVPGSPEKSLFVNNLGSAHASIKAMPPVGERITAEEIDILQKWISEGASWPTGPEGQVRTTP